MGVGACRERERESRETKDKDLGKEFLSDFPLITQTETERERESRHRKDKDMGRNF